MKLVRQLHLISHFWEAFEAGDESDGNPGANWPEVQREGTDVELYDEQGLWYFLELSDTDGVEH